MTPDIWRPPDGRHRRSAQTRGSLVAATRELMTKGILRPTSAQISDQAHCSVRSVYQHHPLLSALYSEALDDEAVARGVVNFVMDRPTINDQAKAIVYGETSRQP
jgi:hypothetical protein